MLNLKRGFKGFFDNHSKALIISVCGVMIGVTGLSVAVVNSGNNLTGAKASQWTTFSQKETEKSNNVSILATSSTYVEPDSSVRLKEVNTTMDSVNVYSVKSSLKDIRRSLSRDGDEDNMARAVNNAIIAISNNSQILSSEDQAWIKKKKINHHLDRHYHTMIMLNSVICLISYLLTCFHHRNMIHIFPH